MRKNNWACFLLILAGIVIGGFIGSLLPVQWLNYGQTFGLSIKITVASILGIIIGIIIYRFL